MARRRLRWLVTRRRVKWVGLVATACLAAAMVASYWYWPRYVWSRANSPITWDVGINLDGIFVSRDSLDRYGYGWGFPSRQGMKDLYLSSLGRSYPTPSIEWLPTYKSGSWPGGTLLQAGTWQQASVPLWLPLLLIAAPTAYLWRTDRRAKPWQCPKCRYDLRGLPGDVCPECGESIVRWPPAR